MESQSNIETVLMNMDTIRVHVALSMTSAAHFNTLLEKRSNGARHQASYYPWYSKAILHQVFRDMDWQRLEMPDQETDMVSFFRAPLGGVCGIIDINELADDAEIELTSLETDSGMFFGKVRSISRERLKVSYTTLVLGMDGENEIVWNFYPGDHLIPTYLHTSANMARILNKGPGDLITVEEARMLRLTQLRAG